jgi:DNA-binding MarR family transcriptional regulator
MYLHPATVVGLIDRLVKKGLVLRTRSEQDRRTVEIALTGQGIDLLAAAPQVPQKLLVRGLEALPADRIKVVSGGLDELVRILGAEGLAPQLIRSSDVNVPPKGKNARLTASIADSR